MSAQDASTDQLLRRAANNDSSAVARLIASHRSKVRKMVAIRMDRRLTARVDPSDVVQETLIEATHRLPEYLQKRPIAFYPWLRELAMNRLIQLHRKHILAQRRSVNREESAAMRLPDESETDLVRRLVTSGISASRRLEQSEARSRVKDALGRLNENDREVLVLKYLEELTAEEIADVLSVSERTVWRRHSRAIERLGELLGSLDEV